MEGIVAAIIAGFTALSALAFAFFRLWRSAKKRGDEARRAANTTTTLRELEREARHASDDDLAKSISRRDP